MLYFITGKAHLDTRFPCLSSCFRYKDTIVKVFYSIVINRNMFQCLCFPGPSRLGFWHHSKFVSA